MILPRAAHTSLRNRLRHLPRVVLFGVLAILLASAASAQQAPQMMLQPGNAGDSSGSATGFPRSHIQGDPAPEDVGVGGMGLLGRVGHVAGDTVGRTQSITYLDLAPYMFVEDTFLFTQGSLFITNQGKMGGSGGVGVRQYYSERDFVLGAAVFYDRDDSRDVKFEQMGVSVELFSQWIDIRANWYKPFGELVQELGTTITPGSGRFQGNNITFSTQTRVSAAAEGADLTFTVPVPGEVAQSMNLEASAGVYNFQARNQGLDHALGWRLRMDADFMERLVHGFAEITKDQVFDTNLIAGVDVNYWGHLEDRPRFGSSQFNRIAQWVRRNRTVVTNDSIRQNPDEVAVNPNTGNPYFVYHVRNVPAPSALPNFPAPTGLGTILAPFQFIDEAQFAVPDADLFFVHADSVFDNRPLVLNDGELVLGEGVSQSIPVLGQTQLLPLPRATGGANRPIFQDTVGPAVSLADNNLFAGFDIIDSAGTALFGDAISGGTVRDVRITNTTGVAGHGVHLQNTTGTITLQDVDISGADGNSFFVSGGNASIVYSGSIINDTGFAVLIENNAGSVNMQDSTITDVGGLGVRVFNSSAATTLGELTLTNNVGPAVHLLDVSGGVTLFQDSLITNPGGAGILIENLTGSFASIGNVSIINRGDVGIDLFNIAGQANFTNNVSMTGTQAGGSHGINFQGSSGTVRFNRIGITDSEATGINIGGTVQNTGQFRVSGQTVINNAFDSSIRLLNDLSQVTFNGININNRRARGIEVLNHSGTTDFAGLVSISNENGVLVPAIDVQDSSGTIQFGIVNATATLGLPGVLVQDNTGTVNFGSLSVESNGNTAVDVRRNASFTTQGGTVIATDARAITMIDNQNFTAIFDSISSTNSDFGIFVENIRTILNPLDHPGDFTVLGTGGTVPQGGSITDHNTAGAHFFNVDRVTLVGQEYVDNLVGIDADDVLEVTIRNNDLNSNTLQGFDGRNVRSFLLENSIVQNNTGGNQVRLNATILENATTLGSYAVTLRNNRFIDPTGGLIGIPGLGDMISISNQGTANGSILSLLVEDNGGIGAGGGVGFSSNRNFDDAILGTTWNGDMRVTIQDNNFRMSANAGQVGVRIIQTRSSAFSDVLYQRNVLNDGGGSLDTGLFMDFAGRTSLGILDNFGTDANGNVAVQGFQMDGRNNARDTAIDLVFRSTNNTIDISRNAILFNSFDGTGVLFETISGPSTVNMDGNQITMFDDGFLPDELAIVFNSVVGTINLSSRQGQDNIINPAGIFTTIPFLIPNGVSTGSILINGIQTP